VKKVLLFSAAFALSLWACRPQKNTTTDKNTSAPKTQTVNAPEKAAYMPAARRESDLLHTRLDLVPNYTERRIYGKATISARPYFAAMNTLTLDARGMEFKEVALLTTAGKKPLTYSYANDVLVIQLDRTYTRSEAYTVFIDYIAKPNELKTVGGSDAISSDKGMYFINPDGTVPNKPIQLWSQGETQASSVWFPTIDRTNERMTEEIYVTVPEKFKTLSNGLLTDYTLNGDGTRTDHWQMNLPHAPYLVMLAIGEFSVIRDSWRGIEVSYYVEPEFSPYAKTIFGKTPRMMEFFSKRLGVDYPWPKYAQVCVRDFVSGAMENTSATTHGDFVQNSDREILDRSYEEYISHELFHQWFGDLVTCESWPNLPLNESFATYGEYLWNEFEYGRQFADHEHHDSKRGYLFEAASGKREPLIRYHLADRDDMFDGHSYNKGGQVLHMLRTYLGDDAFFAGIKLYLERNKFRAAEIHDFRLAMEEVCGEDLNWFFDQWFLAPGHPELDISYSYDNILQQQTITIKQTQDRSNGTPIFRVPMYVDIYRNGKIERHKIELTKELESFVLPAATKPDLVNVDAEKTLLCKKVDRHSAEEWAFQYEHAPLFLDRLEALEGLSPKSAVGDLAITTLGKATHDAFFGIRVVALEKLGEEGTLRNKDHVQELAEKDSTSAVRAAATTMLGRWAYSGTPNAFFKKQLQDKSFRVVSAALLALVDHAPTDGMAEAKKMEAYPERGYKLAVAEAYARGGNDEQQPWFEKTMSALSGNQQIRFMYFYASFLGRCKDETVRDAVPALQEFYAIQDGPGAKGSVKVVFRLLDNTYSSKLKTIAEGMAQLRATNPNATGLVQMEKERKAAEEMKQFLQEERKKLK
jgi:aminopeptidase N